jgi:mono/diheme cytochrome c family protein
MVDRRGVTRRRLLASRLNDSQVASVLTYIRNTWGNAASAVSANQVGIIK